MRIMAKQKKKLKKVRSTTKKRKKSVVSRKPIKKPAQKLRSVKKLPKKAKKILRKKKITRKKKKAVVKKVQKKKIVKIKRRALPKTPKIDFPAESFFKTRIKVIGIGGGGGSIVSEIGRSLKKATFVIADTDTRTVRKRSGMKYFLFGQELTHGLGTGMNPILAREAAEQEKEKIAGLFKEQNIVIFIASLGGGVGSGSTQVFVEKAAENFEGISFGIFTLPFAFEGKAKTQIAQKSLSHLRRFLNVSITIPNERIFKVINPDIPITQAFSVVNKQLIESLESLIDLIYNPGIINIDFADLRAILKGKGNLAFLNTVEASGKDRLQKIQEQILHNSLYRTNNFKAEKILFNIQGSNDLSMVEVDQISKTISAQNPKAKIIFGISKNPAQKHTIKATLLMTGAPIGGELPALPLPEVSEKPLNIIKKEPSRQSRKSEVKLESRQSRGSSIESGRKQKTKKKVKKVVGDEEQVSSKGTFVPVFTPPPIAVADSIKASTIQHPKKPAIRRTALEIKKAQETQEQEKSDQEKEWEIPAFLRKIKFKP